MYIYTYSQCIYTNAASGRPDDVSCKNTYSDQFWSFIMEDYEIVDVSFDIPNGQIANNAPLIAGSGECDNSNGGSTDQTIEVYAEETITETSSFSYTVGFGIEIGVTFSTGAPFIAQGEISTSLSFEYSYTWGTELSTTRTFGGTFPVTCGPGEIIQVECILWKGNLDVPYTITLQTVTTKKQFYSYGTWSGSQGYEFDCDFTRVSS